MNILELPYYLGFSAKKYYSLRNRKKLPFRVISIGNITVGGTGKTPATIALAEEAKKRGFRPVILTRGYKGSAKGPCFVTEGKGPLLDADEAGDEPVLMSERLRGIPIIKGADRYESGMFAIERLGTRNSEVKNMKQGVDPGFESIMPHARGPVLFILDDGFQHWMLQRDKDIVLIDAINPFGNRMLLPFGSLREPVSSLSRADIIVLTKSGNSNERLNPASGDLIKDIRKHNAGSPIFFAEHAPASCRLRSGEKRPVRWLSGKKVFAFCGIGNPESFERTMKSTGAELAGFKVFRDHHRYKHDDIHKIKMEAGKSGAVWIVTTEKDIIKIRNLDLPENILIIEIDFSVGESFYETVFSL
ncbi:MAG: tetraacyldisaccharide 4'-kinase [Nitrospirota bacterium]